MLRGIRGAITVKENNQEEILNASKKLLNEISNKNELDVNEVASIVFTVTPDLNAEFPARAAEELGWNDVPRLCATEINVPGSLPRCIRVLLHVNSEKDQKDMEHVYLEEAVKLKKGDQA
jgi:chorismate mutase